MAKYIDPTQPSHEETPQGAVVSAYPTSLIQFTQMPDKVAYVDLITAQIFNEHSAAIRDMNRELGIGLKGNCYDLSNRIAKVIDPDGRLILPETVFSVGKENADFDNIQDAIDAINDASASKIYVVNIYPGVYEENVVMKPYIVLNGITISPMGYYTNDFNAVKIAPTSNAPIQITAAGEYYFNRVTLYPSDAPAFDHAAGYSTTAKIYFQNGTVYSASQTEPLIFSKHHFSIEANNSRLMANASSDKLFDITTATTGTLDYSFSRCYLRGILRVYASATPVLNAKLAFSYFNGQIYSNSEESNIVLFHSQMERPASPLITLNTASSSFIYAYYSSLFAGNYAFPITKLSGAGVLAIISAHNVFSGNPGGDVNTDIGGSSNLYGMLISMPSNVL